MIGCGHGHVYPNPDGSKARCGGPMLCSACARDLAQKEARDAQFARQRPTGKLGDAAIEPAYFEAMNRIAGALDGVFNGNAKGSARPTGFMLLVFPFGDREGRCNFISNGADRRELVTLMKEMIARFEGQPEVSGNA